MTEEQRQARMYHHLYETNEGIEEHAKRIVDLEELVQDMYRRFYGVVIEGWSYQTADFDEYEQRMRELGVEVDDGQQRDV